jgi:3-hydroxybutyrate dehydrogenase
VRGEDHIVEILSPPFYPDSSPFFVLNSHAHPCCTFADNAAKHGVAGFTKTLALEVATKGITVNAVCPGYVMTELIERQLDSQSKTRGIPREKVITDVLLVDQPIKRFVKPEEVGALVRHLCSDEAAAITGACLSIDGGWTAR